MARRYRASISDVQESDFAQGIPYIPPGIYADVVQDVINCNEQIAYRVYIYQLDYLPIPGFVSATCRVGSGNQENCVILPWGAQLNDPHQIAIDYSAGLCAVYQPSTTLTVTVTMNGHYGTPLYGCHRTITEARSVSNANQLTAKLPRPGQSGLVLKSTGSSSASFVKPPYRTIAILPNGENETVTYNNTGYYYLKKQDDTNYALSIPVSSLSNGDIIDIISTAYLNPSSGSVEIRFNGYLDSTNIFTIGHGGLTFTGVRRWRFDVKLIVYGTDLYIVDATGRSFGYYNTSGGIDTRFPVDASTVVRSLSGVSNLIIYPVVRVWTAPATVEQQATLLRVGIYNGAVW